MGRPQDNAENAAALAQMATLTPDSDCEERIQKSLPAWLSMWEVTKGRGDPWEGRLKQMIEDDHKNKWVDIYGGMNPFSVLAWASFAKTSVEHHHPKLRASTVPCLVVAGESDPIVAFDQSIKLYNHMKEGAEERGLKEADARELGQGAKVSSMKNEAGLEVLQFIAHEHGHILGPRSARAELLVSIADFVKVHSAHT